MLKRGLADCMLTLALQAQAMKAQTAVEVAEAEVRAAKAALQATILAEAFSLVLRYCSQPQRCRRLSCAAGALLRNPNIRPPAEATLCWHASRMATLDAGRLPRCRLLACSWRWVWRSQSSAVAARAALGARREALSQSGRMWRTSRRRCRRRRRSRRLRRVLRALRGTATPLNLRRVLGLMPG